jgi:hypothetical protein
MGQYAVRDILCGEYVVRLPLGRGGMGEVYLTEHDTSGEKRRRGSEARIVPGANLRGPSAAFRVVAGAMLRGLFRPLA